MLFATATIARDTVFLSFTAGAEQIHRLPSNCHQGECLLPHARYRGPGPRTVRCWGIQTLRCGWQGPDCALA
jgi:hypothetical protein